MLLVELMDKEIVLAVIDNYLEELAAQSSGSTRLRTPYPAQDVDGFFRLVGQALKACQESEGVQNPIVYTEDMPEADDNITGEVISYCLKQRKPGHFEQGGQGRAMANNRTRARKKMFREAFDDPDHAGLKIYTFGKEFDNIVEFKLWARTNKTANARAMWFENFMEEYTWYFRASGIKLITYEGRDADIQISPENRKLVCRPLLFYVRTEQITTVKEYNLRSLVVGTSI
jgi:hypothetical protein